MMIWFSCLCGKTCEICETLLKWGVSKYNYVQEIITIKLVIKQ